jgi:carboxymethylenebutenolidase
MCFPPDSVPPITPIAGGSGPTRRVILEALDGNRFNAFEAFPTEPSNTAVIVLPDVRGLFGFYEQLAERFAERGHRAVAIDYFGRTAGLDERPEEFDFMSHVREMTFDDLTADVVAAADHLRVGAADVQIFTVGFCLGGSNSWYQASTGLGLAGAIGFYGHPGRDFPPGGGSVTERADRIECPILGLMAGLDQGITPDLIDAFDEALSANEVEHEIVMYENAPHSFFDRAQEQYADESTDAWRRVLQFIDLHS